MDLNIFITNLKAKADENDQYDLAKVYKDYSDIIITLPTKDKNAFALNVLYTLCRNLEKVPSWRDKVNNKELLRLSIECVRYTRTLPRSEQVKTLICIYHIHKHVIKKSSSLPPELILKLSFMPFECEEDGLLKEHYKIYWTIITDRLIYIDNLKAKKMPISKLLPKLVEDLTKVINIYDTVQFCTNLLTFVVKKLYYIYNDSSMELNESYKKIFDCISKKDLNPFKSLTETMAMNLYIKLNDCLYTVIDNSLKVNDSVLDVLTRLCISLLGHNSDMFHCFQTFYLNTFCYIFKNKSDANLVQNILDNVVVSCEMTEKLGYKSVIYATYPYISQLLRLYIENFYNNMNISIQESCLKIIVFLLQKLRKTNQLSTCENCSVKSGLHDALRLSFLINNIITSTNQAMHVKQILPIYYLLVEEQYTLTNELTILGCVNRDKYFEKLQRNIHNTAISLYKSQNYEYSIKLFNIYVKNIMDDLKSDAELKNTSRALYNKSICELDSKHYEESLKDACLSLIFSLPEGLKTEKYMSLIIDIKSKALKSLDDGSNGRNFQMLSVLEICKLLYDESCYGNLKPLLKNLNFIELLKHEFSMYIKAWPSIPSIAGVWRSLYNMWNGPQDWVRVENKEAILWTLIDVVLETPTAVRTIQDESYKDITKKLLAYFEKANRCSVKEKIVYATLLFLQSEYDIADASQKYGWKITENTVDPEQAQVTRTVEQEHVAVSLALAAVRALTDLLPDMDTGAVPVTLLQNSLQVYQIFVQQLLFLHRVLYGLQLAHVCCQLANVVGDKEAYVRNAGVIIYHAQTRREQLEELIKISSAHAGALLGAPGAWDTALCYICDVAVYYIRTDRAGVAVRALRSVQAKLLVAHERHPEVNCQQAAGRVLRACALLPAPAPGAATLLQRHHLALAATATGWSGRRLQSLQNSVQLSGAHVACARACAALRLRRRASAAASCALPRVSALACAQLYALIADAHCGDGAQVIIDNRLKYIIGLQTSSEVAVGRAQAQKHEQFTPQRGNLETMLDSMLERTRTSPSLPCVSVPAFRTPDFLEHAPTCACYACSIPTCTIIACHISYLEASMYYRAREFNIARNYFNGALKTFEMAEVKLKNMFNSYKNIFNDLVIDIHRDICETNFVNLQLEFLIELSFFELSQKEFEKADDTVVRIHEILSEYKNIDSYLLNEIDNLMIASSHVREVKKSIHIGLESDFENLKLSPTKIIEPQKTPDNKNVLPKMETAKIVKDEEIPKKRTVIKLNFDEASEDVDDKVKTKTRTKSHNFKIPAPSTSKPVLEKMTPRRTRSIPNVIVQQPSVDQTFEIFTPKSEVTGDFFTPCQTTPAEQFFTPMTSVKTYSRRIVKKLENEFSTPKGKENSEAKPRARSRVETGSVKTLKEKRTLKRATSPGKLEPEKPLTRNRRRQQILTDDD